MTSRTHRFGRRTWAGALLALALALTGLPAVPAWSQTAPTVAITKPVDGGKLSIGQQDAAPAVGFQTEVAGTSNANADVDVSQKRPGGAAAVVGTTKADSTGKWSVEVTLPAGESILFATDRAATNSPSPEIRVFVVVRYIFTFYDFQNSAGNWVLIANPGDVPARADVTIAGAKRGDTISIPSKEAVFPVFQGLSGGPVIVDSLDGVPLITTQRTTWSSGDLEEVQGVYDGHLSKRSWFTWYDTRNSGGRDWIVVTNFGTATASVNVSLAGIPIGAASVAPQQSSVFNVANVVGGPIMVDADQPVLASRRTLWKPFNFTEITSIPDHWLSRTYHFTWYDSIGTGGADWILVANPDGSNNARVKIQPPPASDGSLPAAVEVTLDPGDIHVQDFPNTRNGPLSVTSDIPVIATQRALWNNGNSFEEVAGIAPGDLSRIYFQSWYDTQNSIGDWMLQGNQLGQEGLVDYEINGAGISFGSSLQKLEVEFPLFGNRKGGPLIVAGNRSFLQSKRTLWGTTADFMELTGIRGSLRTGKAKVLAAPTVTVADKPNDDGTQAIVSWTAVDDESLEGYWVYRMTPTRRRIAFVHRVADASCAGGNPCMTDTGLTPGAEVTYEVVPLSLNLVEGVAGVGKGTPVDDPPTAPTGLAGVASDRTANLNWADNPETDVAGYHVYRREDPTQPPAVTTCDPSNPGNPALSTYTKVTSQPLVNSEATITGLTNNTRYCFRITAVDKKQPTANESPASVPVTVAPAPSPPIIVVTAPNGGEVLRGDTQQTFDITWTDGDTDKDFGTVRIEYTTNPTDQTPTWVSINDNAPNTGRFTWDPPQINSQSVRVRVTATDLKGNTGADTSNANFAIDSTNPVVNVTAPANNVTSGASPRFRGGQSVDVEWTSTEANKADNPIRLEFSIDNGATFSPIAGCQNVPDNGECTWTVPNATTDDAFVRVNLTDKAGHVGSGQSVKIILDSTVPPAPKITAIDGGTTTPKRGSDDSPLVRVEGGSPFTETGDVRLFRGAKPTSCNNAPEAKRAIGNVNDPVLFNDPNNSDAGTAEPNADFQLLNDGVYTFWACIIDKVGNASPISDSFVYTLDTLAPSTPQNVQGAPLQGNTRHIELRWDAVTDEPLKGYNVYRIEDSGAVPGPNGCSITAEGGTFTKITATPHQGATNPVTFVDTGTAASTQYCYKVTAVDTVDLESARSRGVRVTSGP